MKRSLTILAVVMFFVVSPVFASEQMSIYNLCQGYEDCGTKITGTEGYVCNNTGGSGDYAYWTYTLYIPSNTTYIISDTLALTGYMGSEGSYTENGTLACRGITTSGTCNACDTAGTNTCAGVKTDDNTYACCSADYASGIGVYFWNYTCNADSCKDYMFYTTMKVLVRRHSSEGVFDYLEQNAFTPYLNSYADLITGENVEVSNNTGWTTTNYAIKSSCLSVGSGGYDCPNVVGWNENFGDAIESKIDYAYANARFYEYWWAEYLNLTTNGVLTWWNQSADFKGTNETTSIGLHDFTNNAVVIKSNKPFCIYVNGTDRLIGEPMAGYKNLFDDIGYKIVPMSLAVLSEDWINLSIQSTTSTLEYWGLNVTYINGTCLNCNISTVPDGGFMYNDFITAEDLVLAEFFFKKVDYDEWSITRSYVVHNITAGQFSLFSIFASQLGNSSIISPFARDVVMLFSITMLSLPIGIYSPAGGGLVALMGFGFSAAMGWFSINLFLLILLALGAVMLVMVTGK